MNFPGMPGGGGTRPQLPMGPQPQPTNWNDPEQAAKAMAGMMESCYAKTVMSGVMGFALGGVFGMFMASMQYDTPFTTIPGQPGSTTSISSLPLRQQLKIGFKDMGVRSWSSAKNFGAIGALFSGIECGIEGFRAKNDLANGVAAGCLTGGILARNAGPLAAGGGCVAFAAFSAAIDSYMRMPPSDD